jgi:hypothetical protein
MKKLVGVVSAAVLALGAILTVPAVAAAVPASVVTSSEFMAVQPGNSIEFVRKTFGSNGKVVDRYDGPGTASDYVTVEFPTYYDGGQVEIGFLRRTSGTWYLVSKYAYWDNSAVRTANKATAAEFNRVKQGSSIASVRSTFGSSGTITEYYDAPGTEYDGVVVQWPTASVDGWVQVYFTKRTSGTWVVDTRSAYWDIYPAPAADVVTESEFFKVKAGNSVDFARSTFGGTGTIDYYSDAPGTADDAVRIAWPVASPEGWVALDFAKSSSNVWKVDRRRVYWARSAEPTSDVATSDELAGIWLNSSLDDARAAFGTAGTIVYYGDGPGTGEDIVDVAWYTGSSTDDVFITFWKVAGEWAIVNEDEIHSPWVSITPMAEVQSRSRAAQDPADDEMVHEIPAPAVPVWDLSGRA